MTVNRRTFMGGSAIVGGAALSACATASAVTEAPVDPMFNQPYIDVDEWRDTPVRHRYVHGGFRGTEAKFVFYMPPPEKYQGRFFQYISPVPIPEDRVYSEFANTDPIGFAADSGAIAVGSNQGGTAAKSKKTAPSASGAPRLSGPRGSSPLPWSRLGIFAMTVGVSSCKATLRWS